ncbi:MAG: serine hydrolase domain-containing protein [Steroidobacteraceae bacterium]
MAPAAVLLSGSVARGFEAARAAFEENFRAEGDCQEVGAAFAVLHRGRPVVDLWGGYADRARTRAWTSGTLVNVWSATKALVAVAMAQQVDRGRLRYEDPVASVWPEFAEAGKAKATIGQVMSHQVGLPGFAEPTTVQDLCDWSLCCDRLARQATAWPPGTATSYHALTFGWLAGEAIARAAMQPIARIARNEITGPLAADLYIGLPAEAALQRAEIIGPKRSIDISGMPLPAAARMALVNPVLDPELPNATSWQRAAIPAANGHSSAMGLARLYAMLGNGGELDGARILSAEAVARMTAPATASQRQDWLLGFADCWALGVALNTPGIYGPNPRAFGHSGWGGSFGCADPASGIAIGYVCNQMGPDLVGDPRTLRLCESVYSCVGNP